MINKIVANAKMIIDFLKSLRIFKIRETKKMRKITIEEKNVVFTCRFCITYEIV